MAHDFQAQVGLTQYFNLAAGIGGLDQALEHEQQPVLDAAARGEAAVARHLVEMRQHPAQQLVRILDGFGRGFALLGCFGLFRRHSLTLKKFDGRFAPRPPHPA